MERPGVKLRVIEGGRTMRHRYQKEEIYVFICVAVIWTSFIMVLSCLK